MDQPHSGVLELYMLQLEGLNQQMAEAQMAAETLGSGDGGALEPSQPLLAKNSGQHPEWTNSLSKSKQGRLRRLLATARKREKQVLVRGMVLYWRMRVPASCTYQKIP